MTRETRFRVLVRLGVVAFCLASWSAIVAAGVWLLGAH
jgi:hypothetical protein